MAFERPTLQELIDRTGAEMASRFGLDALPPRSAQVVVARVMAGLSNEMHGAIQLQSLDILPDTASDEILSRWAEVFGLQRKPATPATGTVLFSGADATVIPEGTLLRRFDAVEFRTTAEGTIASGTASVAVEGVLGGLDSNGATGLVLDLATPIAGVESTVTVEAPGLTGGTDIESDAELRARLLIRIRTPPRGGSAADYEFWALEVPGVTRAFTLPLWLGVGTVGVTFLVDNDPGGIIPSAGKVAEVQAYIDERAPVTATVTVFAPSTLALDPEITLAPNTADVQTAVSENLEGLLAAETEPGGTIELSKISEAISTAPGEDFHTLQVPAADVVAPAGGIIILGTPTFSAFP